MALPATARASLLSFLVVHHAHAAEAFAQRFRGGWLVWAPDSWTPPQPGVDVRATMGASRVVSPPAGDALCYELVIAPGQQIVAGRHGDCELLLEHATFSRRQLLLSCTAPGAYAVALPSGSKVATHRGTPLTQVPRALATGDEIIAGDVKLVFYQPADFRRKLVEEQARVMG